MVWRQLHRWLGLVAGTLALVLGITGTLLALDPLRNAWQAAPAAQDLPVATLVQRVQASVPGAEEIRRLPSGGIVVHAFDNGQAQALRVDPADGRVLGGYQPSLLPRWLKNLHRALLLGDAGRMAAAAVALAMLGLSVSGLVLLLRRMGGWRHLAGPVRGTLAQRLHVLAGRVVLLVLAVSAAAALVMSAATFGLMPLDAAPEPDVASVPGRQPPLLAAQLPLLQDVRVQDLRKLNLPAADDPQDTWQVTTTQGQGWVDRYSGQMLAWQDATAAQRVHDWALLLHTGEGAWPWGSNLQSTTGRACRQPWRSPSWRGRTLQAVRASPQPFCVLPCPAAACRASPRAIWSAWCHRARRCRATTRWPAAHATALSKSACAVCPAACAPTTCMRCSRATVCRHSSGPIRALCCRRATRPCC